MKNRIQVTFPIEEAVDMLRLLRSEARCLIENGDVMPDIDVLKRAQNCLSARERIVTALEEFADADQMPAPMPQGALDLTAPGRKPSKFIDDALKNATTRPEDGGAPIATTHGVPTAAIPAGATPMAVAIEGNSMEDVYEQINKQFPGAQILGMNGNDLSTPAPEEEDWWEDWEKDSGLGDPLKRNGGRW